MKKFCCLICVFLVLVIFQNSVFASDDETVDDEAGGFGETLIGLFVPDDEFFSSYYEKMYEKMDEKFGGIINVYLALKNTFENFDTFEESSGVITFSSGILAGRSFDFFKFDKSMLNILRFGFSGFMLISTAVYSIRRVIILIRGGGSGV